MNSKRLRTMSPGELELLQGYHDDEIDTKQRAQVDEGLRANPRVRDALAELEDIDSAVRSVWRDAPEADRRISAMRRAAASAGREIARILSGERGKLASTAWARTYARSAASIGPESLAFNARDDRLPSSSVRASVVSLATHGVPLELADDGEPIRRAAPIEDGLRGALDDLREIETAGWDDFGEARTRLLETAEDLRDVARSIRPIESQPLFKALRLRRPSARAQTGDAVRIRAAVQSQIEALESASQAAPDPKRD